MSSSSAATGLPATYPADCALVVGLPLGREEFERDLAAPGGFDFAPGIRARYGLTADGAWRLYERHAANALRVCGTVAGLGVRVFRSAGLEALRASFVTARVVSLVSHTRLTPLGEADVEEPAKLQSTLLGDGAPFPRALAAALRGLLGEPPWTDAAFLGGLGLLTERAIRALDGEHPLRGGEALRGEVPVEHLNRLTLEGCFPDLVRASEVVELRDGLHPLARIVEAIPPTWQGTLDLTLCNSAALAPWLKRKRPGCLLAVNRKLASLDVRLGRYLVAIQALVRRPRPFAEVLGDVHTAFKGGQV